MGHIFHLQMVGENSELQFFRSFLQNSISFLQKRRRTHGYAIFSSDMRKKITAGIPLAETTKIIAEKWRTVSQQIRQAYEAKAAAINEAENRKFQNLLVQTQRRQQQLQMQQQQQRKQQMMLHHQQQRQAIRERLYPGKDASSILSQSFLTNKKLMRLQTGAVFYN